MPADLQQAEAVALAKVYALLIRKAQEHRAKAAVSGEKQTEKGDKDDEVYKNER